MNLTTAANLIQSEFGARQSKADAAFRRALQKHEDLHKIEIELRSAIIDGKSDEEISALESKKLALLAKLGYDANEFDPKPRCQLCKDTGYVNGRFCDCVKRRVTKDVGNYSAPPYYFDSSDLSVFGTDAQNISNIYSTMQSYCLKFPDNKILNLLFIGRAGTGKTYLASCMANEIEQKGYSVIFTSAFKFNDICLNYHTSFTPNRADGLNALLEADLLVIDDLGTESILKNVTSEYLFTVINERMVSKKHTFITTNLLSLDLQKRYSERTASRLFADRVCMTIPLDGKDLRKCE